MADEMLRTIVTGGHDLEGLLTDAGVDAARLMTLVLVADSLSGCPPRLGRGRDRGDEEGVYSSMRVYRWGQRETFACEVGDFRQPRTGGCACTGRSGERWGVYAFESPVLPILRKSHRSCSRGALQITSLRSTNGGTLERKQCVTFWARGPFSQPSVLGCAVSSSLFSAVRLNSCETRHSSSSSSRRSMAISQESKRQCCSVRLG